MEKIFVVNDYVYILTPAEWEEYKNNLPVLKVECETPKSLYKGEYEGGTKFFEELKDNELKRAVSFMLQESLTLDKEILGDILIDVIADVLKYTQKHSELFHTYENFKVGELHRIYCFHLTPEPSTVSSVLRNEIKSQVLKQVEEMMVNNKPVDISKVAVNKSINEHLNLINAWYKTHAGIKDYCEDKGIEFAFEDGTPLV